jgi:hypothetical protein
VQRQSLRSKQHLGRRLALNGCIACACVLSLRAIDVTAMGQLTAPAAAVLLASTDGTEERPPTPDPEQPEMLDPAPVLPAHSDIPEDLVGLHLNGALYVPLRAALRLIGGEPLHGGQDARIRTISRVGLVEFEIDSPRCLFNDRPAPLRGSVVLKADTTYITARDFADLYEVPMRMTDDGRTARFVIRERTVTARPESDYYEVDIGRAAHRLTLRFRERELQSFPVCVGRGRETPLGDFRILNKAIWPAWRSIYTGALVPGGPGNPLGARWIGLTARGSRGHVIGIHGTNAPSSIGRAVSAGCIRMHNKDVIALYDKVMVGTPVHIHE